MLDLTRKRGAAAMLCAIALAGSAGIAVAQDATPVAGSGESGIAVLEQLNAVDLPDVPNALHAGNCANFEIVPAVPLAPAAFRGASFAMAGVVGGEDAGRAGSVFAVPVAVGVSEVELGIADIVDGVHVLNVADPEDETRSLACGQVAGEADARGNLFIGLEPANDSGVGGVAWLKETDGTTSVTVMLTRPLFVSEASGAFATPTP